MLPTPQMSRPRQVLIVDESEDSREVLRTALERRGIQILEAQHARHGAELARLHHPEVIVLDLEAEEADIEEVQQEYDTESREHCSSLVVLGRAVRFDRTLPKDHIVSKPYHYAPLIRTIERLLTSSTSVS